MKIEFNKELIHKISEMEHLWVSLVSWNLIFWDREGNMDAQMRDWVYEHFSENLTPFINMINEKYQSIGFPPPSFKYLK